MFHVPGQHIHSNVRQLLSLGLGNIKDRYHLKSRDSDFFFFLDGFPVCADYGLLRFRVDFLHFLPNFERGRGKNFDTFFPLYHIALEVIFPRLEACHKGSVWLLHGDKQRIVEAVIMEF